MTIRLLLFTGIVLACSGSLCAQEAPYKIKGKIDGKDAGGQIYLSFRNNGKPILDSAKVQNGLFEFKGFLQGPNHLLLQYDRENRGYQNLGKSADQKQLFIDGGNIDVRFKQHIKDAVVNGSTLHQGYEHFMAFISAPDAEISRLQKDWEEAPEPYKKNFENFKVLQQKHEVLVEEKMDLIEKYILTYPESYFSLTGLRDMHASIDPLRFKKLYYSLSPDLQDSGIGKYLAEMLNAALLTAVGSVAPDFMQPDVNDKPVKLSDFKGKYVLIDFWASWCKPCRAENPHLVKAYHQFKDKNFTILGVSLDLPKQKQSWLDAVKEDNLQDWTQVSDLKGFKNEAAALYAVRGIPQNFLVGPDGVILAKNLRGEKLAETLEKILNAK